jgi:hypothetical protein
MNGSHWWEQDGLLQLIILTILLFVLFALWPSPLSMAGLSV